MTTKTTKPRSRILDEMHATASGLRHAGVISARRMHEYDALCHLDVPVIGYRKIKSIRKQAQVSQAVFAAILNISASTVQKWEIGEKKPSGASLKLLDLIDRKGLEAVL
jgi:putative transcriptional regulator